MENPNFLKQKYADLNKSPEVESAAKRTKSRTGRDLSMRSAENTDARIQNHLNRLKEIFANPDKDKRKRGIQFLKERFHKQFVINPEEIPEAYFESIKRKHREEGRGDIEIPDDYRKELSEAVVGDQARSLDNWIDYLSSDDAKYSDWLKYFAMRSILRMGRYDKKKKSFTERTGGTIAPFPDLNREALAIVLESFERQARGEKPKFGYDIQGETKRQFLEFLEKKNFAKLYALAIEEFKPITDELLKVTEGEWRTYSRGSDPKRLVESIAPYGTGWCLRGESIAARYLVRDNNELQVFYSLDKDGNPTVPRVVTVVNAKNQLTEVRGVAPEENLDQYIGSVVQEKLKEFPDGAAYEKKARDMKLLTVIEKKVKEKQELTKDDLFFLYEFNLKIEGFGYEEDPRVKELRRGRNIEEDMLIIFECTKDQIAHVPSEITEKTKVYVGSIARTFTNPETGKEELLPEYKNIFKKIGYLEHVYTSFPENKIRRVSVEIGGRNFGAYIGELEERGAKSFSDDRKLKEELDRIPDGVLSNGARLFAEELIGASIYITDYAKSMLQNAKEFAPGTSTEEVTLISLTVADLGIKTSATANQIFERAQALGLELCPPDTGPNCLSHHRNQFFKESMSVGMKYISGSGGGPAVFALESDGNSLRSMGVSAARYRREWRADYIRFAFRLRESA